ncbi:hypothetical protein [Microbacterium candidum]|uniref:HNH endonuclease n=1 Tax=Microbacterium candidum TaxID=3041922 RepID=A0ABT7MWL9_9MICO|nr:hypothetical protein [Microbacterium sp. ASV49]MDL9978841.1 hypothetical protein [Microbacterium sp. ASV49]
MTSKHQTPEYRRNALTIRERVTAAHRTGRPVACWRCRRPIAPGQPYDVGHVQGATGSTLRDLAPEHRHRTAHCVGNRAHGGNLGARITNSRHTPTTPAGDTTTWNI